MSVIVRRRVMQAVCTISIRVFSFMADCCAILLVHVWLSAEYN